MTRCSMMLMLVLGLTGCAGGWPSGLSMVGPQTNQDAWPDVAGGAYDFAWHLSGDRAVAPLQIFDNGHTTWLQFPSEQTPPALFGVRDGTQQLLPYRRLGPYVQVEGVWQELVLRGGALTARAQYQGSNQQGRSARTTGGAPGAILPSASTPGAVPGLSVVQSARTGQTEAASVSAFVPLPSAPAASSSPVASVATPVAPAPVATSAERVSVGFKATPADGNMRRALARWARTARWTFDAEHWTLDVDIPLAGSADFPDDFKQAVRQLLAATELSERPLQPCFYSNRVLRVVPLAQACDRSARHVGAMS